MRVPVFSCGPPGQFWLPNEDAGGQGLSNLTDVARDRQNMQFSALDDVFFQHAGRGQIVKRIKSFDKFLRLFAG
jgi:hypothetical protein